MPSYLFTKNLSREDFLRLAEKYSPGDDPLLMAFSPAKPCFEAFQFEKQKSFLSDSEQGRIFSPSGELKWRCVEEQMRVVYLGDQTFPDELDDHSLEIQGMVERQTSEVILWGVRTDKKDEWIEQQIPHRFAYPISDSRYSRGRVAIELETWLNSAKIPRFSRYYRIREIRGEI